MRIPTYDQFAVTPNNISPVEVKGAESIDQGEQAGRQLGQLGQGESNLGADASAVSTDIATLASQTRVEDGINQLRQSALDKTYDPATGYKALKGAQALDRPGGVALPDEYGAALQKDAGNISDTLGTPEQKRMFNLRAADVVTSFKGDVDAHMLSEFQNYHVSVADGAAKLSTQEAELNWNNPGKIDQSLNGIEDPETGQRFGGLKQAIYQKAKTTGMSANEAEAAMNNAESAVHAKVIESAIANNNPTYASAYFQQNKGNMQAQDILQVQGQINHHMDAQNSAAATNSTMKDLQPRIMPTDMDRLSTLVMGQESGGKRYDSSGKLLTSPAGAQGEMQVMNGTAQDPGYGVTPAKDNSPDELARVGRDYLAAMVKNYGDTGKALAAYNAGPTAVDDAVAAAKADGKDTAWLSYLPKETQNYVSSIATKYQTGVGAPVMPTEQEFVEKAVGKLGDSPRYETVTMTRELAEKQYKMMVDSKNQQASQALAAAQKELINNGGNFAALPPDVVSNLTRFDPGKYDDAMKFAKVVGRGDQATNLAAYQAFYDNPDEAVKMPDPEFQQFVKTNFSTSDGEKAIKYRAALLNGKEDTSSLGINNKALNTTMNGRLESVGIDSKPTKQEDKARIGAIQKFVRDTVYDQQQQVGRKLLPEELEGVVDNVFSKSTQINGMLANATGGVVGGTNDTNLISMKPKDIPDGERKTIVDALAKRGISKPTDYDILRGYWKNKYARQ